MTNISLNSGTTGQGGIGANGRNLTGLEALAIQPSFTFAGAESLGDSMKNGSAYHSDNPPPIPWGFNQLPDNTKPESGSGTIPSEDGPEIVVTARLSKSDLQSARDQADRSANYVTVAFAVGTGGASLQPMLAAKLTQVIGSAAYGTRIAAGAAAGGIASQEWLADSIYEGIVDTVLADFKDDGIRNYSNYADRADVNALIADANAIFFPPKSDTPEWGDPDWE